MKFGEMTPFGDSQCTWHLVLGGDRCPARAAVHLLLFDLAPDGGAANMIVCATHACEVRVECLVDDEHPMGSVCNMPGTAWKRSTPTATGRCVMVGDDGRELEVGEVPVPDVFVQESRREPARLGLSGWVPC